MKYPGNGIVWMRGDLHREIRGIENGVFFNNPITTGGDV